MEITNPSAQLTLELPEDITVPVVVRNRASNAKWSTTDRRYHVDTPGFTVVGTNKLFAVYRLPVKAEHWGLAHVPTGSVVFAKFRTREEAEEFGSWMWLNAVNRAALTSCKPHEVTDALGQRVRSRFADNTILHGTRAVHSREIGRNREVTATERLLEERIGQLRILIAETTRMHDARITALNQKEHSCAERISRVQANEAQLAAQTAVLRQERTALENTRQSIIDDRTTLFEERSEFRHEAERQTAIRNQLIYAIQQINDTAAEPPVLRALRGIRVREESTI